MSAPSCEISALGAINAIASLPDVFIAFPGEIRSRWRCLFRYWHKVPKGKERKKKRERKGRERDGRT